MTLHIGDSLAVLKTLPDQSVHCCVTSPPYFNLRDYNMEGQIGLEKTPEAFVDRLVDLFREVRRVLRDDGTLWVNLGDSYAGGGGHSPNAPSSSTSKSGKYGDGLKEGGIKPQGLVKKKDLIGIPWRVAFALQADGWTLRQDIIWAKPNPMPESVTDRCTKSHEYIFMLSKSPKYFYDHEAIKEPAVSTDLKKFTDKGADKQRGHGRRHEGFNGRYADKLAEEGIPTTRNRRSVWNVSTKPFKGAHFATFPPDLIEPCILAGAPAKCCSACGAPYQRETSKETSFAGGSGRAGRTAEEVNASGKWAGKQYGTNLKLGPTTSTTTTGFTPTCDCNAQVTGGTVLDPFFGSGTTGLVAERYGRKWVGIELNPEYADIARERVYGARRPFPLIEWLAIA